MAIQRLRPGPWQIVDDGTGSANRIIEIDYEKFDVPNGGTVEFDVKIMGSYKDDYMTAFRNPVKPQVQVSNTGGSVPMSSPYFKKRKY
jgi:hypothetical protein